MMYANEMASGGTIHILKFIKIFSKVVKGGIDMQTHRRARSKVIA
jgi:hypothetical protein